MKCRNGFVSNSSSSSFLIYGTTIANGDGEDLDDRIRKLKLKLGTWNICGDAEYVGASWDKVGDDETGKQFKERVQAAVDRLTDDLGVEREKCATCAAAWFDG